VVLLGDQKTRTHWRAFWKVKSGRLEGRVRDLAKQTAHWYRWDEIAVVAHICTRHPYPRSRMLYRAVWRRISGGME